MDSKAGDRELVITRLIDAPQRKVFQAWADPTRLKQWFAPLPWTTSVVELDVRTGGESRIVMRDPEGREFPNQGVYLEVVENERLVFTDAYTKAWEPSEKPFMTIVLSSRTRAPRRDTPLACSIGPSPTAKPTKRWASIKVGVSVPTSSPPS